MAKLTKVKKGVKFDAQGRPLSEEDAARSDAIIKDSLDRTKNVSPNQLSADEINKGSPLQLQEQERIRQQEREERLALLNATPAPKEAPAQPVVQPTQNAQPVSSNEQQPQLTTEEQQAPQAPGTFGGLQATNKGLLTSQGRINPVAVSQIAQISDIVRTIFSGKSSKQLTSAEEVMNTYMGLLADDVKLYREGAKSFEEVVENVKLAEASIAKYESNLVTEGRRNLNFWIDKGARIEANVRVQRDRINDFKATLAGAGVNG